MEKLQRYIQLRMIPSIQPPKLEIFKLQNDWKYTLSLALYAKLPSHFVLRHPVTSNWHHGHNKKLCYRRGTARRAISVEILSTSAQLYAKSRFKRFAIGSWPWKSLKVNGNVIIRQSANEFLFTFCRNYASILYCFRDITSYLSKVAFSYSACIWRPSSGSSH